MEKAGENRGGKADQRSTGQAQWTFMVYMAGDNNLDGAITTPAPAFIRSALPGSRSLVKMD